MSSTTTKSRLSGLALLALTLVVYFPSHTHETLWDDNELLFRNTDVRGDTQGLWRLWTTADAYDYYPLTWSSLWLEWRFWGDDPLGYRITNVALHGLAAVMLWRVLLQLGIPGAWFAAALFALHPVCVASAAWISQRKNTLSMVFYLASILTYVRFDASKRRSWYAASIAMFVAALLSKVSIVMLPVVLIGIIRERQGMVTRRDWMRIAPYFAVAALLAGVGIWFQQHNAIGADEVRPEGLAARIAGAGWVAWFYLTKALFPVDLAMAYPRWHIDGADWRSFGPLAALAGVFAVFWVFRRSFGRPFLLAFAYFAVVLLPVLGIMNMAYAKIALVSDHLQYIAIPGIVTLAAALGGRALRAAAADGRSRQAFLVAACGIVAVFGVLTWQRAGLFGVQERLWRDNIARYPDAWMAHQNLCGTLLTKAAPTPAELHEAEVEVREALRLNPTFAAAHGNLATLLARRGEIASAIDEFNLALRLNPKHTPSYRGLGEIARAQGRHADAATHFEKVTELAPLDSQGWNNWGAELLAAGRADKAVEKFRQALTLQDGAAVHFNLAIALESQNKLRAADEEYAAAFRLDPRDGLALSRRAMLCPAIGNESADSVRAALALSAQAVELSKHQEPEILYNQACLLGLAKHDDEALRTAMEALALARQLGRTDQIGRIELDLGPQPAATQPAD